MSQIENHTGYEFGRGAFTPPTLPCVTSDNSVGGLWPPEEFGEYLLCTDYESSKVNIKHVGTEKISYKIINYDKSWCHPEYDELMKYRSVIIGKKGSTPETLHFQQQLLCFSPPKSMDYDRFIEKYPANQFYMTENICINEIVEGTMLNLFYDSRTESWQLATKSAVGANYSYYNYNILEDSNDPKTRKLLTFRDMFMDALDEPHYVDINKAAFIPMLDKTHCYSFVLQHPQNHIVLPVIQPAIYLVALYKIKNYTNAIATAQYIPLNEAKKWSCLKHSKIRFPTELTEVTYNYEQIKNTFCSGYSYPYLPGFMFTEQKTGDRITMRNERYEYIKELRGNYSHVQYLYLNLMRTGRLMEFLQWFPIYKKLFYKNYELYKKFVESVHNAYMDLSVHKHKNLSIDSNIKYIIHRLNSEVFIPSLKGERVIITRRVVWRYLLDNISPNMVMYYMVHIPAQ